MKTSQRAGSAPARTRWFKNWRDSQGLKAQSLINRKQLLEFASLRPLYFVSKMSKLMLVFGALGLLAACEWGSIGYNKGYAPEQPIPFSHELHAGNYKVQCLYCHSSAERASHSAVPSLSICMNCHIQVATDRPAIQQLTEAYTNNKPIPWKKVHLLPDHVRFNHSAHVDRFGAPNACHKCHGPVESMEVLYQHSSLSMGWCVNCHREPENQAPVSCSTCHY